MHEKEYKGKTVLSNIKIAILSEVSSHYVRLSTDVYIMLTLNTVTVNQIHSE